MRLRFRDVLAVQNMPSEEYHGKPYSSLSASRLKTLMESERKFELRHKLRRVSQEEKKHFVFGQILHHVVLESKRVDETNWSNSTVAMFESRNIPQTDPTIFKQDARYRRCEFLRLNVGGKQKSNKRFSSSAGRARFDVVEDMEFESPTASESVIRITLSRS